MPKSDKRRVPMERWHSAAIEIDAQMQSHGAPALSEAKLEKLAQRLRRIESKASIGFSLDSVPSANAISQALNRIRKSAERIANYGETRPEKGAVSRLGQRVSEWRASGDATEFEHLFEPQIKISEDGTDWRGTAFVKRWLLETKLISGVLQKTPSLGGGHLLNGPKEITALQGRILPELFKETYPKLGFGYKEADQPIGHGYNFVAISMDALGYKKPANETIRSARRTMREGSLD